MATADERLARLQAHLRDVLQNPRLPLDRAFFEECEIMLVPFLLNSHDRLRSIVVELAKVLSVAPQPEPVVRLLTNLVPGLSWSEITALDPPVDFAAGLSVGALAVNNLTLDLIKKASTQPQDVALLAGMPNIVAQLITLCLLTPDTGVAHKAIETILALLCADLEAVNVTRHGVGDGASLQVGQSQGQGLMWRRFFDDKDIYSLFFLIPSLRDRSMGCKKEKTTAQGRLLDLTSRMSLLDWNYLTTSHQTSIEKEYGLRPDEGLLDYAFVHAIDFKDDVLMHMTLIQSCAELLKTSSASVNTRVPNTYSALRYLKSKGIHQRAISYWSHPDDEGMDPVDVSFLYGYSAEYYCVYISEYPNDFLQDQIQVQHVLQRLMKAFDVSASGWARNQVPKHDLAVLATIPGVALLPQTSLGVGLHSSPLLSVPSGNNGGGLSALARVFRGPGRQKDLNDLIKGKEIERRQLSRDESLSAGARAAFIAYFHYHPTLFTDLITHAETVALPEIALPAINILIEILRAKWANMSEENKYDEKSLPSSVEALPSDEKLKSLLPRVPGFPERFGLTGLDVFLNLPPQQDIIAWILAPPKKFANLIGGAGDAESAAYKVASAKWDLLKTFYDLVKSESVTVPSSKLGNLELVLESRIAEGMWGQDTEVGGRIATIGS